MPAVAQQPGPARPVISRYPPLMTSGRSLRSFLIGDAVATAGFVLISSVFEEVSTTGHTLCTSYAAVLHIDAQWLLDALQAAFWLSPKLHVTPGNLTLTILLLSLMLYDPLMQHMWGPGGAVFNPANSVAFGAAGTGPGPFSHHLLRSVRRLGCTAGLAQVVRCKFAPQLLITCLCFEKPVW